MPKLAYFITERKNWASGVGTFNRMVTETWSSQWDCLVVERGFSGEASADRIENRKEAPRTADGNRPQRISSVRLALGYVKDLVRDLHFAKSKSSEMKGRTLVSDLFGCETLPIALRLGYPFHRIVTICHTHPGRSRRAGHPFLRLVEKLNYLCANDVIYNSHSVRAEWGKRLGKNPAKGQVIWYGIDEPDTTVPDDYPAGEPDVVDFVFVAQFWSWKGHLNLLSVWKSLVARGIQNIRLILVGDGEDFKKVADFVGANGLERKVILLGRKEHGARYFNGGDVGVLMSTETEAFGIALLEAMSRSKPVLASRLGGIQEVVEDGKTGILVNPFNANEVEQAIETLAGRADVRSSYGKAGYQRWRDFFVRDRMLEDYDDYFSKYV